VQDIKKLAFVTQTTLSVDDTRDIIVTLRQRFPDIQGPDLNDICYATQNRQQSVRDLCSTVDLLLVIGAHNSSNSTRLMEIGVEMQVASYLIDDVDALDEDWLVGVSSIGITAGASAPEVLIEELLARLSAIGETIIEETSDIIEDIHFKLPKILRDPIKAQ
jgi:4-hydroxy-3-methylbut-2-enyl diphosphate reductase